MNTILATGAGPGAVSWLNYGFRLIYMPIGLFGLSIATAALPAISVHAARGDAASVRRTLSAGLRMMLMLNVPATAGLIALASPIVALLFERGSFTPADTAATAAAIACYAPGLVGYSAVKIAVPTFYALHDARTPVVVSIATVVVNLALNLVLVGPFGYRGLATGTAIAALFNAVVLLSLLHRRLGGIEVWRLAVVLGKVTAASVVMAAAAWTAEAWLGHRLPGTGVAVRAFRLVPSIALALAVLGLAARLLRVAELDDALRFIGKRVGVRRAEDVA